MSVSIGLVGDRHPDHPSHRELDAVLAMLGEDVSAEWVATDSERVRDPAQFDGIWLVPRSPYADDGAAYEVVTWARENDVPFLGTCGGLQYAVVEYFRNVLGVGDASHAATADDAGAEVIELPTKRFYMLTLFQPHIGALAGKPLHPLLLEFVRCARDYARLRAPARVS